MSGTAYAMSGAAYAKPGTAYALSSTETHLFRTTCPVLTSRAPPPAEEPLPRRNLAPAATFLELRRMAHMDR